MWANKLNVETFARLLRILLSNAEVGYRENIGGTGELLLGGPRLDQFGIPAWDYTVSLGRSYSKDLECQKVCPGMYSILTVESKYFLVREMLGMVLGVAHLDRTVKNRLLQTLRSMLG